MRLKMRIFFVLLVLVANVSWAASFNCAKASTRSERLICSDKKLLELDEKMAGAYRKAYNAASEEKQLKAEQIEWLKERDACETSECIWRKYESRIDVLDKIKPDFSWLKEYAGQTTNALAWDKRFSRFIKSISPITKQDFGLGEQNLAGVLSDTLGGPPDNVTLGDNRYLTFSACVPRFCLEKGWVWVDLLELTAVAAIIHYDSRKADFLAKPVLLVFSKHVEVAALPQRFKGDLNKWRTRAEIGNKTAKYFINATGKVTNF